MSSESRKCHAKRQLDDVIKRHALPLGNSTQPFWRLLHTMRSASTMLAPYQGRGSTNPQFAERLVRACFRMAEYCDFWVRSPEEWKAPLATTAIQFRNLVSHLFDMYQVPNFMSRVWLSDHDKPWEFQMYLHLAAGRSIRQFDLPVPFRMSGKTAAFFMQAPDDFASTAAMRWAQIRSLGGDSQLARQLTSRTILAGPTTHETFWESVIRFLVCNQIPPDESVEIVQFVHDQKFRPANEVWGPCYWEAGTGTEPLQPELTLQGRSLRSLRRHMAHWETVLAAKKLLPMLNYRKGWERSEILPLIIKRGDEIWTVEELLTREELSVEGGIMRHCVASYAHACYRQNSSIWSMKVQQGEQRRRVLTIQVVPSTKMIWQAKGRANAAPSHQANTVLRLWAGREGLRFRKGM